jgi:hypothetical protein
MTLVSGEVMKLRKNKILNKVGGFLLPFITRLRDMIFIGKDDRNPFEKFYFDDEIVLLTDPPKYEVHNTEDTSDINYVEVSHVKKISSVNHVDFEFVNKKQTPKGEPEKEEIVITEKTETEPITSAGTQRDTLDIPESIYKGQSLEKVFQTTTQYHNYEYKVLNDYVETPGEFEKILNDYGSQGWEVINANFEYVEVGFKISYKITGILKRIKKVGD